MKTHLKVSGIDAISQGQTEFEYTHQTACGYVRDKVSRNGDDVDCSLCRKSAYMIKLHATDAKER